MSTSRRAFLKGTLSATLAAGAFPQAAAGWGVEASRIEQAGRGTDAEVPIRAITQRPAYHWFGYYDKLQFSPTGRYVLGMEVGFEGRVPTPSDVVGVGMVDTELGDRWVEFGQSQAWGWQQGCMLQWIPDTDSSVIWNGATGEAGARRFVSHVLDVETGERRTLPKPIYALAPGGAQAVTTDFARIDRMRPGYGYRGGASLTRGKKAPPDAGIYRLNLETGESELIVSYEEVAQVPHLGRDVSDKWHYFNHLLVNPDGTRLLFLNRYRDFALTDEMRTEPDFYDKYVRGEYTTRMFTAGLDGSDLYELDTGDTSHIIWRDPEHVLAWTRGQDKKRPNEDWPEGLAPGFWLLTDQTEEAERVGEGVMTFNGHQTYVPGTSNEWILSDGYPGEDRKQPLYLYHIPTGQRVDLGQFYEPEAYTGEWRTDLHPRASRDGTKVCIDSTHGGEAGRQMYLLDVSEIVSAPPSSR